MIAELAKQFGVAESKVKELVEEGKVGFPEVQKVIESLTDEGGKFSGLMEAQSKTITGQISNIEDAVSMMFNEIGQQSEGVINTTLSGVSYMVEHYEPYPARACRYVWCVPDRRHDSHGRERLGGGCGGVALQLAPAG